MKRGILALSTVTIVALAAVLAVAVIWDDQPSWVSEESDFTMSVALADLDNDGDLDLICGNYKYPYSYTGTNPSAIPYSNDFGGYLVGYEWTGNPDFDSATNFCDSLRCLDCIAIADFDADGDMDIAVGAVVGKGNDGGVWIYENQYDENAYGTSQDFGDLFSDEHSHLVIGGSFDAHCVRWADVDGDGEMDLTALEYPGRFHRYYDWDEENGGYSGHTVQEASGHLWSVYPRPWPEPVYPIQARDEGFTQHQWYTVFGTTMEFGDIDRDGDLDLFVNARSENGRVRIYKNYEVGLDYYNFDRDNYRWLCTPPYKQPEDPFCGSFGLCKNDGNDSLVLAVGSMSFTGKVGTDSDMQFSWGNDIYILRNGSLQHIAKSYIATDDSAQSVTDIQWAYLEGAEDDYMDLVAVAYPMHDGAAWKRGFEQVHIDPYLYDVDSTFNTDIWSSYHDLSTSLALGDIDGSSWDTVSQMYDDSRSLRYLPRFPFIKLLSARTYIYSPSETEVQAWNPQQQYDFDLAYDPLNGWFSVGECDHYDSLKITYSYSLDYDLAVGNNGKNAVYFYGESGTCNSEPSAPDFPDTTVAYSYSAPEAWDTEEIDLKKPDGLGGTFPNQVDDEDLQIYLDSHPNISRVGLMAQWNETEIFQGHFFWGWLDTNLTIVKADGGSSHICSWDRPVWTMGDYVPDDEDSKERPSDELLHAMFVRNLVNRYRPNGIYDQLAVGGSGNAWGDWGVDIYQFENEPNANSYGYGDTEDAIEDISEKMFCDYQMIHKISDCAYSDWDSLKLVSPNFTFDLSGDIEVGQYVCPPMPYLNNVDAQEVGDGNIINNYCDFIAQQLYCGKVATAETDTFVNYQDPCNPEVANQDEDLHLGLEQMLWSFYTPGLDDYFSAIPGDWAPVLNKDHEKPFFIYEWSFCNDWRDPTFDMDVDLPQPSWIAAQIAEMYSVDVFPQSEDTTHRLVAYNCPWLATETENKNDRPDLVCNTCAGLLNDTEERNIRFDSRTIYDPANDPDVYCYTYENTISGDDESIHFLKTCWDLDADQEDLFVKEDDWDFVLLNDAYYNNDKIDCYTPTGASYQKNVLRADDPPYITFAKGEMGPAMTILHELDDPITQNDYSQGLWLDKGWNLVSWQIVPVGNPEEDIYMSQILPSNNAQWFHENGGNLYTYEDAVPGHCYPLEYGSGDWIWDLDWSYHIWLDTTYFWQVNDRPQFNRVGFTITPSDAWEDSCAEWTEWNDQPDGWFFMGYSAPGYCKLASIPNTFPQPSGDPQYFDYEGPFHNLIWNPDDDWDRWDLVIVKDDHGRVYIPKPLPIPVPPEISAVDQIGVLEPGRGYFLGFNWDGEEEYEFDGWDGYPDWPNLSPQPDSNATGRQIASARHFQFKSRTQWSYPVLIDTVDLDSIPLAPGDEIAVFDGELCVGASVYDGKFPIVISCWKDDIATLNSLDGYVVGHEMNFVWYDASQNCEAEISLPPTTQGIDDDPVSPDHSGFGRGFFARRNFTNGYGSVKQLPQNYKLDQNYPNPFNSETIIALELPQRSHVLIEIFNIRGQRLRVIYDGIHNAGWPKIRCQMLDIASGVYFYRVMALGLEREGKFSAVGKMLLLK